MSTERRETTGGAGFVFIPTKIGYGAIEDNRLLLDGLSAMLNAQGLKVVATARSGAEALRHVARLRPHLILLDATLGDRDSLKLVASVKKAFPEIKVIVMHLVPAQEDTHAGRGRLRKI